jgi:hypothetical protein
MWYEKYGYSESDWLKAERIRKSGMNFKGRWTRWVVQSLKDKKKSESESEDAKEDSGTPVGRLGFDHELLEMAIS